jgi:hypothetical protein
MLVDGHGLKMSFGLIKKHVYKTITKTCTAPRLKAATGDMCVEIRVIVNG